jgi:hypothetical protein
MPIPVTFTDKGKEYQGELSQVIGSGFFPGFDNPIFIIPILRSNLDAGGKSLLNGPA